MTSPTHAHPPAPAASPKAGDGEDAAPVRTFSRRAAPPPGARPPPPDDGSLASALAPLLDADGLLADPAHAPAFVALAPRAPGPAGRSVVAGVVAAATPRARAALVASGALPLLDAWLQDAASAGADGGGAPLLAALAALPVDVASLKASGVGKTVRRIATGKLGPPPLAPTAATLLDAWKRVAHGDEGRGSSDGGGSKRPAPAAAAATATKKPRAAAAAAAGGLVAETDALGAAAADAAAAGPLRPPPPVRTRVVAAVAAPAPPPAARPPSPRVGAAAPAPAHAPVMAPLARSPLGGPRPAVPAGGAASPAARAAAAAARVPSPEPRPRTAPKIQFAPDDKLEDAVLFYKEGEVAEVKRTPPGALPPVPKWDEPAAAPAPAPVPAAPTATPTPPLPSTSASFKDLTKAEHKNEAAHFRRVLIDAKLIAFAPKAAWGPPLDVTGPRLALGDRAPGRGEESVEMGTLARFVAGIGPAVAIDPDSSGPAPPPGDDAPPPPPIPVPWVAAPTPAAAAPPPAADAWAAAAPATYGGGGGAPPPAYAPPPPAAYGGAPPAAYAAPPAAYGGGDRDAPPYGDRDRDAPGCGRCDHRRAAPSRWDAPPPTRDADDGDAAQLSATDASRTLDGRLVCVYFSAPVGCRRGDACTYAHLRLAQPDQQLVMEAHNRARNAGGGRGGGRRGGRHG